MLCRSPAWSGLPEEVLKLIPGPPFSKLLWEDGAKGLLTGRIDALGKERKARLFVKKRPRQGCIQYL